MIQSHPEEEAWQLKRFKEAEQKKLFALHSENQILMAKQYEFEVAIADYAHKIDSFSQKSKQFEEENKQLKAEVDSLNSKNRKIEDLLNKRNEEYCQLYNYLFTEKRGNIQEAIFKEIDLHNRLNQIQHESDTQIINKLRQIIKGKNEELLKNSLRISELNEALLTSSFQYQEKINLLKYENQRLQKKAKQKQSILPANDNISEYCLQKKVQGLLRQMALYQKQLQNTKKELTSYRKNYNSLQSDKKLLQAELNTIKNNLPTFDRSVYDLMAENRIIKQNLEDQRKINQNIQSPLPETNRKPQDFNNYINSKTIQSKHKDEIERLMDKLQGFNDEINVLRNEHKASNQAKLVAEKKYASLQLVATSAVEKLKQVISTYVPYYFRRGGLENYNLTKEQQEFLAQRNVQKTLQAAYQQINSKIAEAHQSKQRQNESEKNIAQQRQKIRRLQFDLTRCQGQIEKFTQSIESLMEQKRNHDCSLNNRYGYEGGYDKQEMDQIANSEDQYISRVQPAGEPLQKSYQIKIQILEKAIEQFQTDRSQLISIIKSKQVQIAELSGEIEALNSTAHINQLNVQVLSSFDSRRQSFERQDDMNEEAAQIQPYLDEVREQLKRVSEQYNVEKEVLIRQFERKEALSLNKYLTLLKHFDELTAKYNSLEPSTNNNPVQQVNNQNPDNSSASQLPLDVQETVHQPQRDQATISESAVENFTDTLKKYEKEFNRFVGIYEAQIKKSMQNSMISEHGHESDGESQQHSEDPVDKMQILLNQHIETIKNLQNLLQQKAQQFEIQVKYLEEALTQKKENIFALETRLEEAETTISDLKGQILTQKTGEEFTSSESANTAFLILNAKNKQIDQLKASVQKLRKSYEEKGREVAKLRQLQVADSRVQAEELRVFMQIMQQQNLLGVLEAAAQRLQ